MQQRELIPGLRITVKPQDIVETVPDTETYRVIANILSDKPDKNRLIKHYYVWMSHEYISDRLRLSADYLRKHQGIPEADIASAAMEVVCQRFEESDMNTPKENGADCSNKHGVLKIDDATNYIHPSERNAVSD